MCLILFITSLNILLLAFMYAHLHQAGYIIVNGAECTYFCLYNLWCYLVPAIVDARLG